MIATGQDAFSASVAAVDPSSFRAMGPIPSDPTQTMAAPCDSSINAVSGGPQQDLRLDGYRLLPGGLHRGGRCTQRRLGILDVESESVLRRGRLFFDVGDVDES